MGALSFISTLFSGGVGDVVEKVGDAIHKNVTTDKERIALDNEAAKAAQDFSLALAKMDTDLALGQDKINEIEAASPKLFVSGWRPFIGWICGVALGLAFIPKALVLTAFWACKAYLVLTGRHPDLPELPPFPDLGAGEMMALVSAMLGLGGMRTYEKVKGVQGSH